MSMERTAQDWYELGYARRGANDLDGAREAFERALGSTDGALSASSRAGAFRALGELADVSDDVAEAIRLYRTSLELDPRIGVRKRLRALERLQADPAARRRINDRSV
jgi:tetratricopeptide (TPR) repeat protein